MTEPRRAPEARPNWQSQRRAAGESAEFSHYLSVLWQRRLLLLLLTTGAVVLALLYGRSQPPVYETRSSILIEASMPHVLGSVASELVDPSPANFYMMQDFLQTSRKVLTSDSLSRRVVARLRLLSEPSFFASQPVPGSVEEAAEELLNHYSADLVAETRVLVITARHQQPQWAKKIADAVADEFVQGTSENRELYTQRTSQQLAEELDAVRKGLREAELSLFQFKTEHDMLSVSLEDRQNQVARQIDKYTDALAEVRLRKLQRQSQLEGLRALRDADPLLVPLSGIEVPPLLADLRRVYAEEQRRLAELRVRYEDRHPQLQQQASKVEQILHELKREVGAAVDAAAMRASESERDEKKVQAELLLLKQEGLRISRLEIEYNRLRRDAESLQKQHAMLLNRSKETGMAYRLSLSNMKVLDYARLPKVPVSPRKRVAVVVAVILAWLLGLLLSFALAAADRTIRGPEDVEQHLGVPLLGRLPRLAQRAVSDQIVRTQPRSPLAEAFRALRTGLLFFGADRPLKTVLVTSSVAREGKTLCCASLGITLAQGGAKTLLVDCDLRRPRLAAAFGLRQEPGLTSVLALATDLQQAICPTEIENLSVLPSGPLPPNPAELLGSAAFRQLLARLAGEYDRILIDSPPAVPVTDAAVLAAAVDGVLLIVRQREAQRDLVLRAVEHLAAVGAQLLGVVLNAVEEESRRYRAYYAAYSDGSDDEGQAAGRSRRVGRS
jgi:succinoglycan biosynthesis transport protein ExoP